MAPPPQAIEVHRVQLSEPTDAASGSGRLYANALDVSGSEQSLSSYFLIPHQADAIYFYTLQLSAIGALLGDAVFVRVWPVGSPDRQYNFLCTACSHQQGVSECAMPLHPDRGANASRYVACGSSGSVSAPTAHPVVSRTCFRRPAARGGFVVLDPCTQCPPLASNVDSLRQLSSLQQLQGARSRPVVLSPQKACYRQ